MRRIGRYRIAWLMAMSTPLVGCSGGGGDGVASTPAPPAAALSSSTPPSLVSTAVDVAPIASPATRPGTFDTIARIDHVDSSGNATSRLAAPSEIKITAYQAGPLPNDVSYSIEFASPDLPGNKSALTSVIKP